MLVLNVNSIISLGQNIAFLLCLPLVCHFLWQLLKTIPKRITELAIGIAFALVAMIGMLSPLHVVDGLFIDGRVAIIAVAALYSTPAGIIAAVLIAGFRLLLGGVGMPSAVATIFTAAIVGVVARKYFSTTLHKHQFGKLLILGIALVIFTALWAFLSPFAQAWTALQTNILPIIIWYPACTILLGNLFAQEFIRQDTEQALHASSERYLSIVNDQLDPVVRWKADGTITFANEAYCRLLKKSQKDLIGSNIFNIPINNNQNGFREIYQKLVSERPIHNGIYQYIESDGTISWIEWTDRAFFNEGAQLREVQSVGRDVTALKQVENQLKYQSDFQTLFLRLATRLINVPGDQLASSITEALKEIGLFLKANRCALQILDEAATQYTHAFEWHSPDLAARVHTISSVVPTEYIVSKLWRNEDVLIVDIHQTPELQSIESPELSDWRAIACAPIFRQGRLLGAVNINWDEPTRISPETFQLLRVMGEIYLNATDRVRNEAQILKLNADLEQRVIERTLDLQRTNQQLQNEIFERNQIEIVLRQSEAQLRSILDTLPIPVIVVTLQEIILYGNPVAVAVFDADITGAASTVPLFNLEPTERTRMRAHLEGQGFVKNMEVRFQTRQGSKGVGLISVRPFQFSGQAAFLAAIVDVTDLKEAQEAERTQRNLTQALLDSALTLTSSLQLDEVVQHVLTNLQRVIQHDVATIMILEGEYGTVLGLSNNINGTDYVLVRNRLLIKDEYYHNLMFQTRQPVILGDISTDPKFVRMSGNHVIRSFLGMPILVGQEVIGFLNMGSQQAEFYSEAHLSYLQLFAVQAGIAIQNARLYKQAKTIAILEERNKLARDLHDSVTQTLFAANSIAEALPQLFSVNPAKVPHYIYDLHQLTRGAMAEMRSLLVELRPEALIQTELGILLTELCDVFTGKTQIEIEKKFAKKILLQPDIQVVFYRVAQETLNNIAKHAQASQVSLTLHSTDGLTEMRIKDNGRGFDPKMALGNHFGLKIMSERATEIAAQLAIHTQVNQGTEIVFRSHVL